VGLGGAVELDVGRAELELAVGLDGTVAMSEETTCRLVNVKRFVSVDSELLAEVALIELVPLEGLKLGLEPLGRLRFAYSRIAIKASVRTRTATRL
jgi:hypothetical protein